MRYKTLLLLVVLVGFLGCGTSSTLQKGSDSGSLPCWGNTPSYGGGGWSDVEDAWKFPPTTNEQLRHLKHQQRYLERKLRRLKKR